MAQDWIKMRTDLWDHPKVVRIVSAICPQNVRDMSARCRIIGALFRTWALADTHTSDGILDGYDAEALNAAIGIDGWAENMQHVGWLIIEPQRLIVPRFENHNGESAKKRAEDASRKRRLRKASEKRPQNVRKMSAKNRTREEKRRIDIEVTNVTSTARNSVERENAFEAFWNAFPRGRRTAKAKAEEAFAKACKKTDPETIIAAAEEYAASPVGRGEFVKGPAPWLNGHCWLDDRAAWQRSDSNGKPVPKQLEITVADLEAFTP